MTTESAPSPKERKAAAFAVGFRVFVLLAIITGVEFFVSLATNGSVALLLVIGLLKAALILNYFMHIYSLWRGEEH